MKNSFQSKVIHKNSVKSLLKNVLRSCVSIHTESQNSQKFVLHYNSGPQCKISITYTEFTKNFFNIFVSKLSVY